jgi:hypothetical protein
LPAFGFTNAFFISRRLIYDYLVLERGWGLSLPAIFGIRLCEYSFIRASNDSNPMKGLP